MTASAALSFATAKAQPMYAGHWHSSSIAEAFKDGCSHSWRQKGKGEAVGEIV